MHVRVIWLAKKGHKAISSVGRTVFEIMFPNLQSYEFCNIKIPFFKDCLFLFFVIISLLIKKLLFLK